MAGNQCFPRDRWQATPPGVVESDLGIGGMADLTTRDDGHAVCRQEGGLHLYKGVPAPGQGSGVLLWPCQFGLGPLLKLPEPGERLLASDLYGRDGQIT